MKIQFLSPQQNTITVIKLKNFEFLPLFYLFPKKLLQEKCPNLVDMPRSVHGIFTQEKWFTMLASDFFLQVVCDITAFFVWPAFGITTYMECFSGHDPLWRLAHATQLWENAFEKLSGITPQGLANNPKAQHEWTKHSEFLEIMISIGIRGMNENNLMPLIESVREIRCIEDYDKRYSNAKIDFHRKWYHTRTRFTTVSLEQLIENHDNNYQGDAVDTALGDYVYSPSTSFESDICSQMDIDNFYKTLNPKDKEILEMRVGGATYQEIADELDYKTHSAVIKRIRKIANKYADYIDEQEGMREYLYG